MKKILIILFSLIVLSSCAKENGSNISSTATVNETDTAAAPASSEMAEEKVSFTISNGSEPMSLDPAQMQGTVERRIYEALFEGLVTVDEFGQPVPGLAESWEVSEDGLTYTFKIRENAYWSDGKQITAHDVVYSWLRELDPMTASPYAWFPSMFIEGAEEYNSSTGSKEDVKIAALDDFTFQMTLKGPFPYAINALTHYTFAVVPQQAIEAHGEEWVKPENFVGNGPFVLSKWTPQDKIVCTRSETYWDKENVHLDEVVYLASDDTNTNYTMFIAGQSDWCTTVPTEMLDQIMMMKEYQVSPQLSTYYYSFNVNKAPLDNADVRKAISYAIDRETLVDNVLKAGQIPSYSMVPPMEGYEGLTEETYDPEYAAELLAKAGYPNGAGFPTITILYNTDDNHKMIAEFIQSELKNNLNINVELENQEWATYNANRDNHNFEIARAGWVGDYQDPNTFLDMFVTGVAMNDVGYANPEYDELIEKASTMPSGEERFQVLQEAEEMLVTRDMAVLPLYYYSSQHLIDTSVWGGWEANIMDYHPIKAIYKK